MGLRGRSQGYLLDATRYHFCHYVGNWVEGNANHRGREQIKIVERKHFFFFNDKDLSIY